MTSIEQRVAVVTGGGTGIGRSIAVALATAGCRVVVTGRRAEKLQETVSLAAAAAGMQARVLDVSQRADVQRVFQEIAAQLGPVQLLVNSAGTNVRTRTMAEMTPAQWDQVLAVNATGAYNCMHCVLPAMREAGDGLIVNISSIAGKRAAALGGVAYCASKFAMTALGTAVGNEDAAHGIRVTNVYPGEVNTPILENRPQPVSDAHKARILQPEDVAQLVLAIAQLPPRAHVPEVVIKPLGQEYM